MHNSGIPRRFFI